MLTVGPGWFGPIGTFAFWLLYWNAVITMFNTIMKVSLGPENLDSYIECLLHPMTLYSGPTVISFGHNHIGLTNDLLSSSSDISGPKRHHLRAWSALQGLMRSFESSWRTIKRDHFVVQQCYLRVQCHKRALLCQLRAQWGHWVAWWGNSRASWDYKVNLSCKWSKSRSLLILLNSFGAQGDHLGVQ